MCGRYTFFTDKKLQEIDEIVEQVSNEILLEQVEAGEIFPTNVAPVLILYGDVVIPKLMIWGFPNFRNKGVIINARSETAGESRMFRSSLKQRRCVVPSTGFYEWDGAKNRFLFNVPDSGMLYMAGLFDRFDGRDRFVILTRAANASVEKIHDRMPVVLLKDQIRDWLSDFDQAKAILSGDCPDLIKN